VQSRFVLGGKKSEEASDSQDHLQETCASLSKNIWGNASGHGPKDGSEKGGVGSNIDSFSKNREVSRGDIPYWGEVEGTHGKPIPATDHRGNVWGRQV